MKLSWALENSLIFHGLISFVIAVQFRLIRRRRIVRTTTINNCLWYDDSQGDKRNEDVSQVSPCLNGTDRLAIWRSRDPYPFLQSPPVRS